MTVLLRRGTQLQDAAVADVDHVVVTAWYCLGMWFMDSCERASANSGSYHSTMVDYSRAGRAGSAGSAGRNLNVCGSLW